MSEFDLHDLDLFMYQVLDTCKKVLEYRDPHPFDSVHVVHVDNVVLMWLVRPKAPSGGHVAWALEWSDELMKHFYTSAECTRSKGLITAYSQRNQERLKALIHEYAEEPGVVLTFYYWKEDESDATLAA